MPARDRILVEAQIGVQAATDVRHTVIEREQKGLPARSLDLDVAAALVRARGQRLMANTLVQARDRVDSLGGALAGCRADRLLEAGADGCLR